MKRFSLHFDAFFITLFYKGNVTKREACKLALEASRN